VCAPRLSRALRKWTSLRALCTGEPLTLPVFRGRALQAAVDRWLADDPPHLTWVYSSSMAQYVLGRAGGRKVMQFAELDSDKFRQYARQSDPLRGWLLAREARRLLAFERAVARDFDRSFVVSDVELELFTARIPEVVPLVLPNGVDVEQFASAGDHGRAPHALIFTGVMDYEPNVDGVRWFVAECWPTLRARYPDAQLWIVGSRPTAAVRALARQPGITVTGRVPATPPWFDRASIAIAPLRLARGVQNKVLEALSMGLPVVATPQAAQGLGDVPATAVRTAADADGTVAAIGAWFDDPALARAGGRAGADWVRAHWRWEHMVARLDAALHGLGLPWPRSARPAPAGAPPAG
jgi:sugar transferase (PEP-CTERM/EpsH1 system associated)